MFRHPKNVCMTYFTHMRFSLYLSYSFFRGFIAALIHAIYPDILVTYSSDLINKLSRDMRQIGCTKNPLDSHNAYFKNPNHIL